MPSSVNDLTSQLEWSNRDLKVTKKKQPKKGLLYSSSSLIQKTNFWKLSNYFNSKTENGPHTSLVNADSTAEKQSSRSPLDQKSLAILNQKKISNYNTLKTINNNLETIQRFLNSYKGMDWRSNQLAYQIPPQDKQLLTSAASNEIKFVQHQQSLFQLYPRLYHIENTDTKCFDCGQVIGAQSYAVMIYLKEALFCQNLTTVWPQNLIFHHIDCFTCSICSQVLVDFKAYLYPSKDNSSFKIYCFRHFLEIFKPRCAYCDSLIFEDECTEAEDKVWHIAHFCCFECKRSLGGQQYVMAKPNILKQDGITFNPSHEYPYCLTCFDILFGELCEECGNLIGCEIGSIKHEGRHWHANDICFKCNLCCKPLLGKPFLPASDGKIYCSILCSRNSLKKYQSLKSNHHYYQQHFLTSSTSTCDGQLKSKSNSSKDDLAINRSIHRPALSPSNRPLTVESSIPSLNPSSTSSLTSSQTILHSVQNYSYTSSIQEASLPQHHDSSTTSSNASSSNCVKISPQDSPLTIDSDKSKSSPSLPSSPPPSSPSSCSSPPALPSSSPPNKPNSFNLEDLEILNLDLKSDFKSDLKVEAKNDSKTELNCDLKVNIEEGIKKDTKVDLKIEQKVNLKVDSNNDLIVESKVNSKVEPKSDLKVDNKVLNETKSVSSFIKEKNDNNTIQKDAKPNQDVISLDSIRKDIKINSSSCSESPPLLTRTLLINNKPDVIQNYINIDDLKVKESSVPIVKCDKSEQFSSNSSLTGNSTIIEPEVTKVSQKSVTFDPNVKENENKVNRLRPHKKLIREEDTCSTCSSCSYSSSSSSDDEFDYSLNERRRNQWLGGTRIQYVNATIPDGTLKKKQIKSSSANESCTIT